MREISSDNRPNIVIIMADQLRYDVVGGPYTPHLNQLADESTVFDRAYCASPLCVPARGAFYTGMHPNSTGCLINPWTPADAGYGNVRAGIPNLYGLLEQDWDSWNVGKQHFLTEEALHKSEKSLTRWTAGMKEYKQHLHDNNMRLPGGPEFKGIVPEMAGGRITRAKAYSIPTIGTFEPGFDYFFDGFFTHNAVEAIRRRNTDKPLLLNMMFLAPHPPFDIPEPWFSRWEDVEMPDNVGRWAPDQSPLQLYNLTGAIGTKYTRQEWKRIWRAYLGLVSLLDDCIGNIIAELKDQGIYDNSLILFTSDHGEMLGSHALWQKMCMYEESARIPLFIKFPLHGKQAVTETTEDYQGFAKRIDVPVSAIDVLPTLCDYLGVDTPNSVQGISLMPAIKGKSLSREYVYIQFDGNGARGNFQRCILNRQYKLIVDLFKDETFLELYDVERDHQEQCNLCFQPEYEDDILALLKQLRLHMMETGDLLELAEPEQLYHKFLEDYKPYSSQTSG